METVVHMTYDQLQNYIPKVGDQIAVTNFCRRYRFTAPSCSTTTLSLINKLKRGNIVAELNHGSDGGSPSTSKASCRGRPIQNNRKIKVGWKLNGKMIREIRGGGCRIISVNKTLTKNELLEEAVNLFFPNGVSKFGPITNFTYDLLDYQENTIDGKLTVGHIYNSSKLTTLRFYLATNSLDSAKTGASTENNYNDLDSSRSFRKKIGKMGRGKTEKENSSSTSESDNILEEFLSFHPKTGDEPQSQHQAVEEVEQLLHYNPESPFNSVSYKIKIMLACYILNLKTFRYKTLQMFSSM